MPIVHRAEPANRKAYVPRIKATKRKANLGFLPKDIKWALKQTDGSVYEAAQLLNTSEKKIDTAIRLSKRLSNFFIELKTSGDNHGGKYQNASLPVILDDLKRRQVLYRSEALDAIRELATMPMNDNSGMMQVKLLAAVRLYNETGEKDAGSTIGDVLQALNVEYQQTAPRISEIRKTVYDVKFDNPRAIEAEISSSQ